MPERARIIIVHSYEHTLAALETAAELHTSVILQSAPDALFYAGALYLLHMFERAKDAFPAVKARFILDCSDAGAETVAALQTGHRYVRSSAPEELRHKLEDIAKECGAEMVAEPYQPLDLLTVKDIKSACRQWLS